jgi:hypothetical protein
MLRATYGDMRVLRSAEISVRVGDRLCRGQYRHGQLDNLAGLANAVRFCPSRDRLGGGRGFLAERRPWALKCLSAAPAATVGPRIPAWSCIPSPGSSRRSLMRMSGGARSTGRR